MADAAAHQILKGWVIGQNTTSHSTATHQRRLLLCKLRCELAPW
jgi:hypothetical protein